MPIYFGSQLINEARVGTQLYDGYVGSQMVHGKARLPAFTYDGTYEEHPASYYGLSGDYTVVAFLSSGTLKMSRAANVDVFIVGGGGGSPSNGVGAGGGYTNTVKNIEVDTSNINVVIGAGGAANTAGNASSFAQHSAAGGQSYTTFYNGPYLCYAGGDGGSGGAANVAGRKNGGNGGSDGSAGAIGDQTYSRPGTGQGTTTRAFGENSATLFAGGGGSVPQGSGYSRGLGGTGGGGASAASGSTDAQAGTPNTGGGAGGGGGGVIGGGSGIILMRLAQ